MNHDKLIGYIAFKTGLSWRKIEEDYIRTFMQIEILVDRNESIDFSFWGRDYVKHYLEHYEEEKKK